LFFPPPSLFQFIYLVDTLPPHLKTPLFAVLMRNMSATLCCHLCCIIIIPAFQFPSNGRASIVSNLAWNVFLFRPFPIMIRRRCLYPATVSNAFIVTVDAHLSIQLPKNVPNAPRGTLSVISSFSNMAIGMISPPEVIFIQRPPRIVLHHSLPTVLRETASLTHC
jgi:hypothetical protein